MTRRSILSHFKHLARSRLEKIQGRVSVCKIERPLPLREKKYFFQKNVSRCEAVFVSIGFLIFLVLALAIAALILNVQVFKGAHDYLINEYWDGIIADVFDAGFSFMDKRQYVIWLIGFWFLIFSWMASLTKRYIFILLSLYFALFWMVFFVLYVAI